MKAFDFTRPVTRTWRPRLKYLPQGSAWRPKTETLNQVVSVLRSPDRSLYTLFTATLKLQTLSPEGMS